MSQATDISSATHVADFWRCGLLLPHSPISLLCWSHDTWRRSRMLHPTQPIHDARKLHEQSMQWNPQCPCETMPRSWAIHWYMTAVHSILWLTTLGQSNREEFLMVEFIIKLKSCHVCLKQKWCKKKRPLFFKFLGSSQKGGDQRYVPVQHSCFHFALAIWSIMTTTTQQQRWTLSILFYFPWASPHHHVFSHGIVQRVFEVFW